MACNAHGDVYDAIGYLEGIVDKGKQFQRVKELIDGHDFQPSKPRAEFVPNPAAVKRLTEYVKKKGKENRAGIRSYLEQRGSGENMIDVVSKSIGWWPGYETAVNELDYETLRDAGIPGKNPKKQTYSWGPAGVVVKLASGFKFFYYDDEGKSQKIGTKRCVIFPCFCAGKSDTIYLTEGEMSALAMLSEGYEEVSPTGGVNGLKKSGMVELLKYSKIYIVFDGDRAGRSSTHGLKEQMRAAGVDADIYIVRLPAGQDPDDLIKAGKKDVIDAAIAKSEERQEEIDQAQGIELDVAVDDYPFNFAGYDERNYYVIPKNQSIPLAVGRTDGGIKGMIFDIAPDDFWRKRFSHEDDHGNWKFSLNDAIAWFRFEGQRSGLFDQNKALGIGPHRDGEEIVFNLGDQLYLLNEQKSIDFHEYRGRKFFIRSKEVFRLGGASWDVAECRRLFSEITKYGFTHTVDFMLVAGWVVLAPSLTWRLSGRRDRVRRH
jgi:hypothetical protein